MSYLVTYTGKVFVPGDLSQDQICIEDIVHSLSMIRRFGGHTAVPWTVAEHSIEVARLLSAQGYSPNVVLQGLLHDAHEAYVTDMPTPLKTESYRKMENQAAAAVRSKFKIPEQLDPMVKSADRDLGILEARQFHLTAQWCWDDDLCDPAAPTRVRLTPDPYHDHLVIRESFRAAITYAMAGKDPFSMDRFL